MKYTVEIGGQSVEVEVDGERVLVNGKPTDSRLGGRRGEASRTLVGAGETRSFVATRGEDRGSWNLSADGILLAATVLDTRARAALQTGAGGAAGRRMGHLKAPMPGLVVRVLIEAGVPVEAGQPLVVIEAMKMENELKAAGAGTVSRVHVAPGARVEKGSLLVELS